MESLCIRIPKESGEKVRRTLAEIGVIDTNLKIKSDNGYLLIPVVRQIQGFGDIIKEDFEVLKKEPSVSELLGYVPAYEQIGDIAVIDREEEDVHLIANVLIQQKRIRTVLHAETAIGGEYRTRGLKILAGEKRTHTLYRENGCRYRVDLARVYFTPRLATERMRIADQIQDGDVVVDMFAGIGQFSILIAKKCPSAEVIAIDKNPDAIKYLKENVRLNKVSNVEIREGDARVAVRGISGADHIIMNLPHSALEFLDAAFGIIKKGGVVHFYAISHQENLFDGILKRIEYAANRKGMKIIPIGKRIVRPYAPYQYNICIDFRVTQTY